MSRDEDLSDEPPASINPYDVLEIDEKATADAIKSAYRKKALKHHPGPNPILAQTRHERVNSC
jgi:DnaJ family protein C protein 9